MAQHGRYIPFQERNDIKKEIEGFATFVAGSFNLADLHSQKILTLRENVKYKGWKILRAMHTLSAAVFIGYDIRAVNKDDQTDINNIVSQHIMELYNYIENWMEDEGGEHMTFKVSFINDMISKYDVMAKIDKALAAKYILIKNSPVHNNLLFNEFLTANLYSIHSTEGVLDDWNDDIDGWIREMGGFDPDNLPGSLEGIYRTLINRKSEGSRVYHVRTDVIMDRVRKTLNIRAESRYEKDTVVSSIKALDRKMGRGGYLSNIWTSTLFSRLRGKDLQIDVEKYKIVIETDGGNTITEYEVFDREHFKVFDELKDGTVVGNELVMPYGIRYSIICDDNAFTNFDVGLTFSNTQDGLGVWIEDLGDILTSTHKHTDPNTGISKIQKKAYGLNKDLLCKSNHEQGIAAIYKASGINYEFYKDGGTDEHKIEYIGKIAPLLSDIQYSVLMTALGFAGVSPNRLLLPTEIPKFKDVIKDLSLNPQKYGYSISDRPMLVSIQNAFGFTVDSQTHEVIGVSSMEEWWDKFEASRDSGLMLAVYEWFQDLLYASTLTSPIPGYTAAYIRYAKEFTRIYFWSH